MTFGTKKKILESGFGAALLGLAVAAAEGAGVFAGDAARPLRRRRGDFERVRAEGMALRGVNAREKRRMSRESVDTNAPSSKIGCDGCGLATARDGALERERGEH